MIRGEMSQCLSEEPPALPKLAVRAMPTPPAGGNGPPALPPRDTETELKLAATPRMLARLRDHPLLAAPERHHQLVSTYFDTLGGRLSLAGASLRLRDKSGALEQTFKLAARQRRQLQRAEWNVALGKAGTLSAPDIEAFSPRAHHTLTRLQKGATLHAFARVEVARTTRLVTFGRSLIEVAFDEGRIVTLPLPDGDAGEARTAPVCELELELVRGCSEDLLTLAGRLPLGPDLCWAVAGKAERAHALAYDRPRQAIRGALPTLSGTVTGARALQTIGWGCLIQMLGNIRLIIEGADDTAEAVHQLRVALRRLRAALGLFTPLYAEPATKDEVAALRALLADLASMTAPAREAHVLCHRLSEGVLAGDADGRAVLARLARHESEACATLRLRLAEAETQQALIRIGRWLEGGAWLASPLGAEPVMGLVAARIERRRGRIRKRQRKLDRLDDAQLHALRIDVKKLRYAAGFCALMLPDAAARAAQAHEQALAGLQDVLGEWHDLAAPPKVLPDMPGALADRLRAALDHAPLTRKRMLARARNWLAREKHIAPWWRDDNWDAHGKIA